MSMDTINGYVLLAQPADWSDPPKWKLAWDTEVADALRGNEGRSALREMPRPTFQYSTRPLTTVAQTRLTSALLAGLASGRCCAPLFGRASWLAADTAAGATVLTIESSAWRWQVGDWLLLYKADGGHQTRQIAAINAAGTGFTLAALDAACAKDAAVYPLFFGRPEMDDITPISGERATVPIRLVGDEFKIDPAVPVCCRVADLGDIDFAVIRFTWLLTSGEDCDIHVGISDPPVPGNVGYGSTGGDQVPAYPAAPWLLWGKEASTDRYEEALVDLKAIAAAYPAAATVTIRLQARWFGVRADGNVALRFTTWRGGVMQGPADHQFSNVGGQVRQTLTRNVNVPKAGADDANYYDVGTLVYTVATRGAVILPP